MATDFWSSTHYRRWIVDRATAKQARAQDLQYVSQPEHLDFLAIYFANAITKLCKKLGARQRVIATAIVFFRRFYLKNSYCETDPFIVIAACVYVASKAEESPVHIKNVISESRSLFSRSDYNYKTFPSDQTKLAEMEFYLVDDLECDLTIFHPYRTLMTLCTKGSSTADSMDFEEGETGLGVTQTDDDGQPRYWGTGQGQLELEEGALQGAWFIINDTYRSDICLLYPPHLIATAAIYLTLVFHSPTRTAIEPFLPSGRANPNSTTTRQSSCTLYKTGHDPVQFLASLSVSVPLVAAIAQEIISLYTLWERYKEDDASGSRTSKSSASSPAAAHTPGPSSASSSSRRPKTPMTPASHTLSNNNDDDNTPITPKFLSALLLKMREARFADMAHSENGRMLVVNRMLERTKDAG